MALIVTDPKVALVYSDAYLIRGDGKRFGTYFDYFGLTPCRGSVLLPLVRQGCFIPMPSVVVHRQALTDVGGFNPSYNYCEDYDAWLKIASEHSVDFVPQPLCSYRVHSMMTSETQKERTFKETLDLLARWIERPNNPQNIEDELYTRYIAWAVDYFGWLRGQGRRKEAWRVVSGLVGGEVKSFFRQSSPRHCAKTMIRRASMLGRLLHRTLRARSGRTRIRQSN